MPIPTGDIEKGVAKAMGTQSTKANENTALSLAQLQVRFSQALPFHVIFCPSFTHYSTQCYFQALFSHFVDQDLAAFVPPFTLNCATK